MYEYFKRSIVLNAGIATIYVNSWQSKGTSNESILAPDNDQSTIFEYKNGKRRLLFKGDILSQTRVTYNQRPKVSIFIVYKLSSHTINADFALKYCLFGAVKITKDKNNYDDYVYSGYGIDFESKSTFNHTDSNSNTSIAHNVIIFGADSNESLHSVNKLVKNLLILGKCLIKKISKQTVYADHEL